MQLVNLALMAQKATAVGKSLELFATFGVALVRPVMLVHVFAVGHVSKQFIVISNFLKGYSPPFALAIKRYTVAFLVFADHLAIWVARRLLGALITVVLP